MEGALAYMVSAVLVGFGIWVFVDGMHSVAPIFTTFAALTTVTIGLVSAFGDH